MKKLILACFVMAAMLVPASSASAALTGEYAKFSNCPLSNPAVEYCVYANSTSGQFTVGTKTVPLVNPQVLQGGVEAVVGKEILGPLNFFAAANGETLTKSPQPVPGGLLGVTAPSWWPKFIRDWFNQQINEGLTGVTATVELAGAASGVKLSLLNTLSAKGTALALPVKVKLSNAILGSNCYIGSNSSPITLNLTTGATTPPPPNTSISGSPGTLGGPAPGIIAAAGNKLVDNSFAAPGASGCGGIFSFLIDPLVDSILGTPSPAGTNTAILEGTTYLGDGATLRSMLP